MPAFVANILVDTEKNFEDFKVTITDIRGIFSESYVMFRGRFASNCVVFFEENFGGEIHNYQNLNDKDWIKNTLDMIKDINQRSVFFYLEDHRLVAPVDKFEKIVNDFDELKIDYLNYSYYDAGGLITNNILPLNPNYFDDIDTFQLTSKNIDILNKISPNYWGFSLLCFVSIDYLRYILNDGYLRKINNKYLSYFLTVFFPYPKYRSVVNFVNIFLKKINFSYYIFPINSPHNTEKLLHEFVKSGKDWRIGVLHEELFADSDDDNGVYGTSLIKRGLYPFSNDLKTNDIKNSIEIVRVMNKGDKRYYKYHSQIHRIYNAPILEIELEEGNIELEYENKSIILKTGKKFSIFINKGVLIKASSYSKINLKVYDEVFNN
jgi:hypothetical protein